MNFANEIVDLVRDIIKQELDQQDSTVLCEIESQVDENHYNVFVIPDTDNIIHNVCNMTKFSLKKGDYVYVYKIKNKLNNSFICYKIIPPNR